MGLPQVLRQVLVQEAGAVVEVVEVQALLVQVLHMSWKEHLIPLCHLCEIARLRDLRVGRSQPQAYE